MAIKTLREFALRGKRVLLRFDGDVPVDNGKITDDFRLRAVLPTIEYCLQEGASLVLLAHMGRPEGKIVPELSNKALQGYFLTALKTEVALADSPRAVRKESRVTLLENLRFWPGEEKNDPVFSKEVASLGDIYCNDAFAVSHRAHASIVGIPALLPHCAGFKLMEEVVQMTPLVNDADAPYVVVMGGAKAKDKSPIIKDLIDHADAFLLGGLLAITYLRAQGGLVGKHEVEDEDIKIAQSIIRQLHEQNVPLYLPLDFINEQGKEKAITDFTSDDLMLDTGPKTCEAYRAVLQKANTIFWNGAMGKYEDPKFANGTVGIAHAIAASHAEVRIGSGGDTTAAIHEHNMQKGFTFISTGGGATLEFIAGKELPGIKSLQA